MHQPAALDGAAEMLADCLMAETYAHQRLARIGAGRDQIEADARLVGRAGAGRNEEACCIGAQRLGGGHRVIALHAHLGPQLHQVMDEVEGEAVVIVDDDYLRGGDHCASAFSSATDCAAFSRFVTTMIGPTRPLSMRLLAGSHRLETCPSR